MSDNFQILVPGVGDQVSVIFPSGSTAKRGQAVSYNTFSSSEQPTAKLAAVTDKSVFGLVTRDITAAGGPTDTDQLFGKGLEYPDKAGAEVTADPLPELFAAEGPDVLEQTTNPILLASTPGTLLSFIGGKLHLAQATEQCFYQLVSTSATTKDTANTLRVIVQKLQAPKVA